MPLSVSPRRVCRTKNTSEMIKSILSIECGMFSPYMYDFCIDSRESYSTLFMNSEKSLNLCERYING